LIEKHTIVITALNKVGVIARISSILSSRGYNIMSIIGAPTENPDIYKIHIVLCGSSERVEQVTKQLNKLIDITKIVNISHRKNYVVREYVMIRVRMPKSQSDIFKLIDVFKANILDISPSDITSELSGPVRKIERFIELLMPFGIKECVRSGSITLGENS